MTTIYAIPGLGTTAKLFSFLNLKNYKIVVLQWPITKAHMSLKEYAQLFLSQIDTTMPFILMGVSFGGMICSELSHIISPEKTILISSCKNKNEFPFLLRLLKWLPIYKLIPEKALRKFAKHSTWILGFEKDYKGEFMSMIQSMPANYFSHSIEMIVNWEQEQVTSNCFHIHGKKDKLLLYKNVKVNATIAEGTHAMIVYQAKEISELINDLKI